LLASGTLAEITISRTGKRGTKQQPSKFFWLGTLLKPIAATAVSELPVAWNNAISTGLVLVQSDWDLY